MYYNILQRQYFLFSPKGVASHPLPEGRGLTATLDNNILRTAFSLNDQGSTIITAAGNFRRPVSSIKTRASLDKKIIVVASLSSSGYPSDFTNYGDAVTLSAPSDRFMRSYDYEGNSKDFGGTSAAAALVTGTLGGFTLLSRQHLTTLQADGLLRKTAISLPNLPSGHSPGAGMLNSYKVGMVALRIRERCRIYVTESLRNKCLSHLLKTEETYLFNNLRVQSFPFNKVFL